MDELYAKKMVGQLSDINDKVGNLTSVLRSLDKSLKLLALVNTNSSRDFQVDIGADIYDLIPKVKKETK